MKSIEINNKMKILPVAFMLLFNYVVFLNIFDDEISSSIEFPNEKNTDAPAKHDMIMGMKWSLL